MLITVACSFHLILTKTAEASLQEAETFFKRGMYDDALRYYLEIDGIDRASAIVGASRTLAMTGQYTEAEDICRQALKDLPNDARISTQLAEILTLKGKSSEALQILERLIQSPEIPVRSLVQYGKILQLRGRTAEAIPFFEKAIDQYNEGLVFESEAVAMVGLASWALESYQDANQLFREAIQIDNTNLEAHVLWGNIFLEKYNEKEAQRSFFEALNLNKNYVPALVGAAQTLTGRNVEEILSSALTINPHAISAHAFLAKTLMENDQFELAKTHIDQILQTNPESIEGETLRAAIAFLKDEMSTYESIRKTVDEFSPNNGQFYAKIAEFMGRKYRFKEAVELARLAVKTNPNHWNGYTILGMNLLRLGEEEEGRKWLEFSFEKDPFNIWTDNMLKVLDTLAGFETRRNEHFIVKMHKDEVDVLWPYFDKLLNESWNTLTKKYNFIPEGPILIEVFNKKEDFAVRSLGLPNIGPLVGICFGKVITLVSPNAMEPPRSSNWQEIVWHEFAHVITLQMTKNRMPRWLSEGLSVYEEHAARTEWGRRQNLDLVKAVQNNQLLSIKQLNDGFSKARNAQDLNFAYYQSSLVVKYIAEKYGVKTLKTLILQYKGNQEIEAIFQNVFKKTTTSFDEEFLVWVDKQVKKINVYVHSRDPSDQVESHGHGLRKNPSLLQAENMSKDVLKSIMLNRVKEHSRDFQAHFQLGILYYENKDFKNALKHLKTAQKILPQYGGYPSPYLILANLYKEQGKRSAMIHQLKHFVEFQQHAFTENLTLAKDAIKRRFYKKAIYYLERAIAVDPFHQEVHEIYAKIAMKRRDYKTAIREYQVLVKLDVTDPVNAQTNLAEAYLRGGKKSQAKQSVLAALETAPTYERAQNILLDSIKP